MYVGGGRYLDKHPNSRIARLVKDKYELFCFDVFAQRSLIRFIQMFGKNLFDDGLDCKNFLEQFFNIKFSDK